MTKIKPFQRAQLCLQFTKNRDGSSREAPHVHYPDNGRVTIPQRNDDQGRSAYLLIHREESRQTVLFLDQEELCLIDELTHTRVIFDGAKISILKGHGDEQEFFDIPLDGSKINITREGKTYYIPAKDSSK